MCQEFQLWKKHDLLTLLFLIIVTTNISENGNVIDFMKAYKYTD